MDLGAFSLSGKTVMVTGANTGIGQGIALSIGRAGGRVNQLRVGCHAPGRIGAADAAVVLSWTSSQTARRPVRVRLPTEPRVRARPSNCAQISREWLPE